MELKIKMKLNPRIDLEVVSEGTDLQDIIRQSSLFLEFDGKCAFCDSDNITMRTRITKEEGHKYTEYLCLKCGATRSLGQFKTGGFFLKDWEEKWAGEKQSS